MRLLLDTHIWLWALLAAHRLAPPVRRALSDPESQLWLSPISTWEALLLIERGRVVVEGDVADWVREALSATPVHEAALTHNVALESRRFRFRHHDPADRFLAATAVVYDLTLVTADRRLLRSKEFAVLPNR